MRIFLYFQKNRITASCDEMQQIPWKQYVWHWDARKQIHSLSDRITCIQITNSQHERVKYITMAI